MDPPSTLEAQTLDSIRLRNFADLIQDRLLNLQSLIKRFWRSCCSSHSLDSETCCCKAGNPRLIQSPKHRRLRCICLTKRFQAQSTRPNRSVCRCPARTPINQHTNERTPMWSNACPVLWAMIDVVCLVAPHHHHRPEHEEALHHHLDSLCPNSSSNDHLTSIYTIQLPSHCVIIIQASHVITF